MKTKIELTTEMKSRIRSVVKEYVSQRLFSLVCEMDDNEVRDTIKDMLFDENIIDGVHYEHNPDGSGELPLTTRRFEGMKNELTDYLIQKYEGTQPF